MHSFHFAAFAAIVVVATDPCAGVQAVSIRGDKTVLAKAIAEKLDVTKRFKCDDLKTKSQNESIAYIQEKCIGGSSTKTQKCLNCLQGLSSVPEEDDAFAWYLKESLISHMQMMIISTGDFVACTSLGQNFENDGNCVVEGEPRGKHCIVEDDACRNKHRGKNADTCNEPGYTFFTFAEKNCCGQINPKIVEHGGVLSVTPVLTDPDIDSLCEKPEE
jgi:hypothetical protein